MALSCVKSCHASESRCSGWLSSLFFHVNCGQIVEDAFRAPAIPDSTDVHIFICTLNNRRVEELSPIPIGE